MDQDDWEDIARICATWGPGEQDKLKDFLLRLMNDRLSIGEAMLRFIQAGYGKVPNV